MRTSQWFPRNNRKVVSKTESKTLSFLSRMGPSGIPRDSFSPAWPTHLLAPRVSQVWGLSVYRSEASSEGGGGGSAGPSPAEGLVLFLVLPPVPASHPFVPTASPRPLKVVRLIGTRVSAPTLGCGLGKHVCTDFPSGCGSSSLVLDSGYTHSPKVFGSGKKDTLGASLASSISRRSCSTG